MYLCAMQTILIEPQYVGSCSYWKILLSADTVCFDMHEHYVKRSYRNRAHILSANGLLRLSIPLESGKNQHAAMKDVRISYKEDWQSLHWQSLISCYSRSPFFEYYEDRFQSFYTTKFEFLSEYNVALFKTILSILKKDIPFQFSERYFKQDETSMLDRRNFILPRNNQVEFFPEYTQVFNDRMPFISDLSVFDVLFNAGNKSQEILNSMRFKS